MLLFNWKCSFLFEVLLICAPLSTQTILFFFYFLYYVLSLLQCLFYFSILCCVYAVCFFSSLIEYLWTCMVVVLLWLEPKNCVCSLFERFSVTDWTIKNISFTFCFPTVHKTTRTHNVARTLKQSKPFPNAHAYADIRLCYVAANTPSTFFSVFAIHWNRALVSLSLSLCVSLSPVRIIGSYGCVYLVAAIADATISIRMCARVYVMYVLAVYRSQFRFYQKKESGLNLIN